MFNTLKRLYLVGRLTKKGMHNAVFKKWITPEQYKEIVGEEYEIM